MSVSWPIRSTGLAVVPPGEFVSGRTRIVAELKAAGDGDEAARGWHAAPAHAGHLGEQRVPDSDRRSRRFAPRRSRSATRSVDAPAGDVA